MSSTGPTASLAHLQSRLDGHLVRDVTMSTALDAAWKSCYWSLVKMRMSHRCFVGDTFNGRRLRLKWLNCHERQRTPPSSDQKRESQDLRGALAGVKSPTGFATVHVVALWLHLLRNGSPETKFITAGTDAWYDSQAHCMSLFLQPSASHWQI